MDSFYEKQKQEAIKDIMLKVKVSETRAADIYTALYDSGVNTPGFARIILTGLTPLEAESITNSCLNIDIQGNVVYSYLSEVDYETQLNRPYIGWVCPCTGRLGNFDDDYFEKLHHGA